MNDETTIQPLGHPMSEHIRRETSSSPHSDARPTQRAVEEALRLSEEKYRTLTENITVGIFRSTPGAKGRFLEINGALVKMLGYSSKEELFALDVAQIYRDPADRLAFSQKLTLEGSVKNEEFHLRKKDGTPIVVSETAIAVKDGNGAILYFDGIVEDITERKRAVEEILLQKAYFEKLFNSAPEAIVLHGDDDRVINVNEEFTRLFGYTREEAVGRPINDLVAQEEFRADASVLSDQVIHGQRVETEAKRKRKDGTVFDVSILGSPIVHNGGQLGVYAIYRDITERKKAVEELQLQKTYLERLFNSAAEAIVLHDNDDIVVNVNEEFTRLFGYTREEAIGRPINELVARGEFMEEAQTLSRKVIHGVRVEADSRRRRKDGTLVDVSILGAPIFHNGRQFGVYAIYRDVTERKKAEEARIRMQEETRMAHNIQMNFLPKSDPRIPGYDIAGRSIPAMNVGGDYYDFIPLDDHRLAIGVGDVSGHGLAASLVMANLQATIRGQVLSEPDPEKCLERANKLLFRSTDARTFISLFYGILDTRDHTLTYANAGQDLPVVFPCGRPPVTLNARGIALGLKEDVSYRKDVIPLGPGDRLFVYTDGIPEAMNARMEDFGTENLLEIVRASDGLPSADVIGRIIAAVSAFTGSDPAGDDMTAVVLSRTA